MDKVRVGERFVLGARGGVWQKTMGDKARCIYGPEHGLEILVPSETPVYVYFSDNRDRYRKPRVEKREPQPLPSDTLAEREDEAGNIFTLSDGSEIKALPEPCPPRGSSDVVVSNGVTISVGDEDDEIVKVVNATAAQVAAYVGADVILVEKNCETVELQVSETAFDARNQTIYIRVRE